MDFIKKLNWYVIAHNFMLIYPLYVVLFSDSGLSASQVALLLIINSIATLIMEIPSGMLADRFSRKTILIIGQMSKGLGFLIWLVYPSFLGFSIGMILWGIQSAMHSGTFSALVYDELKHHGREKEYVKINGRASGYGTLSGIVAAFGASAGILLGYSFIIIASIIAILMATCILFLITESTAVRSVNTPHYTLRESFRFIKQSHILKLLIFVSTVMTVRDGIGAFWPLFFDEIAVPLVAIGATMAVLHGAEAVGEYVAHYFEKVKRPVLSYILIFSGILFLIATLLFNFASIPVILAFIFVYTIVVTIFEGDVQHQIPSKIRATVSSVNELFSEISQILVYAVFGFAAAHYSTRVGFYVFAVFIMVLGLSYFVIFRKENKIVSDGTTS